MSRNDIPVLSVTRLWWAERALLLEIQLQTYQFFCGAELWVKLDFESVECCLIWISFARIAGIAPTRADLFWEGERVFALKWRVCTPKSIQQSKSTSVSYSDGNSINKVTESFLFHALLVSISKTRKQYWNCLACSVKNIYTKRVGHAEKWYCKLSLSLRFLQMSAFKRPLYFS